MAKITLKDKEKPPLIDNPSAPDMFVDEAVGFFFSHNTIRITFATDRANHSGNPGAKHRLVAGRLVMSLAAAEGLRRGLTEFIEHLKSKNPTLGTGSNVLQ